MVSSSCQLNSNDILELIVATFKSETPKFDDAERIRLYRDKKPINSLSLHTKEYRELQKFSREVEIILLTINDNEFHAALNFIEKPVETLEKSVFFPKPNMVVGMFANKKTAVIQTAMGGKCNFYIDEAITAFPEAQFVIGVGVCYAFDSEKHKLGDVLVSDKICDLANLKFTKKGKIEDRGQVLDVVPQLYALFCQDCDNEYLVTDTRESKVYSGEIESYSSLLDDKVMCNRFHKLHPKAIGGEMEGGVLLDFERKRKIKGVIVIKGVVDYADGSKSKEWQYTAAMAALNYTKTKLLRIPTLRDKRKSKIKVLPLIGVSLILEETTVSCV
jgi:nucleoside phosphorylase